MTMTLCDEYAAESFGERLSVRDFMDGLRGPEVTADGKTVIYRQRRDVRRIAIADLSRVLTTKPAAR